MIKFIKKISSLSVKLCTVLNNLLPLRVETELLNLYSPFIDRTVYVVSKDT